MLPRRYLRRLYDVVDVFLCWLAILRGTRQRFVLRPREGLQDIQPVIKPYYESKGITLYQGDCREIIPQLEIPGDAVVVMDPPYGISHSSSYGASWQDTTIANDHSTELRDWLVQALSPRPMFVFGSWKVSRPAQTKAVLIWDKGPAFGMGDLSFPWKPSFEEIYVIGDGFKGKRDEGVLKGHMVVSWESKGRCHPHQKPISLLGALISKAPASAVVDPCIGSGSTLRAAKDLGMRAIGIELEERYCEMAVERLAQETLFGTA